MKQLTILEHQQQIQYLISQNSSIQAEWQQIDKYTLPGRFVNFAFQTTPPNTKKNSPGKYAPAKSINLHATQAIGIMASGFHGGATSPARPWVDLIWSDTRLNKIDQFKNWLADQTKVLRDSLNASNFYEVIHMAYEEFGAFNNMCIGVFTDEKPFNFELLTAGEYIPVLSPTGQVTMMYRFMFLTNQQLVDKWPGRSSEAERDVKNVPDALRSIIHCVYETEGYKLPYKSVYFETGAKDGDFLKIGGFEEMPWAFSAWDIINNEVFGTGPGSLSLTDVKRLQEIEKASLKALHKSLDPPVNAPARSKGGVQTLPGGVNYYTNPLQKVEPVYNIQFDLSNAGVMIDKIELRISRFFYNDVFLTAVRDPNASPLKATEANIRNEERMLRLGPVLGRMHKRVLAKLMTRCFSILMRSGKIVVPDFVKQAGSGIDIDFISPLAKAQKALETRAIGEIVSFAGSMASIKPEALDGLDADVALKEFADTAGGPPNLILSADAIKQIRKNRAEQQAAKEKEAKDMAAMQADQNARKGESEIASNYAGAGETMMNTVNNSGIM
jgi:hypothetical protein